MIFENSVHGDRKQTFESLRHLTIEETYELSESLLKGSSDDIKSELGDLLLHIVFYAKIGSEQSSFDIADVANRICDKLIQRHPHVYGDVEVTDEKEVKQNWEQLKLKHDRKGVLDGVPDSLPSLVKAYRMQEKAAGVGFDWDQMAGVIQKIEEELQEFYDEVDNRMKVNFPHKFGESQPQKAPQQVVAGSSRTPPTSKSNKVKLTQDDVALAKKWNIPLEKYAAEKKKAEYQDYKPGQDRAFFIGTKNTDDTTIDGGPVVEIKTTNPRKLKVKKPGFKGGNLKVK